MSGKKETSGEVNQEMQMRHRESSRTSPPLEIDNYLKPTYGIEIDDLEQSVSHSKHYDDDRSLDNGLISRPLSPHSPSGAVSQVQFDVNVYQQKKTLAQGMMDLALISANANQLRYILSSKKHPFFLASLVMISMSLLLQIGVGIGLIWNSRYDVKQDADVHHANRANNWTVIGIFLVTILNVFITSFGVFDQTDDVDVINPYLQINTANDTEIFQRIINGTYDNSTITSQ